MIGKTISHYRIIEKLGEGAMGVVYKAEDEKLRRTVALKFLSSEGPGDTEDRSRFRREAQASAALDHPNICGVYEIGEAEGQTFIAMACIEGESLEARIKAGEIDPRQALEVAAQVVDGLAAAHSKGIVHRDIKPSNLMITPQGQVKIMDFGLAKLAEATRLTKPGDTIGTLAYMSPEQVRGDDADHRSDIWSVGVVLYEMVTGQRPFEGAYSQAVIYSILNEKAPPLSSVLPDVPKGLEVLVDCCLAKEPDDRFESAEKLAGELRSIKLEESGVATATAAGVMPESPKRAAVPTDYPREIAGYKILQCLGEGGMGMVYLAEQEKPVRRRVALKIIKLGMDTKEVIARFESERQALAMMNHPNIARIFNAGATEEGRPYFAMEYVPGEPITEYCDKHRLSIRERLGLFIQVCRAIHHAHQKAIIHRDIKPSNILVMLQDNEPVPKVIDFGVAKATTQRLTERTVFTEMGELVGTPEYMSPEQLEMTGLDVDTTTDVYSLGVLLYELLVGALPFEPETLRQAGWDGLRKMIREVDPPRPSTRISTMAEQAKEAASHRRTETDSLQKLVHGELDWITMRALEKDRTRRYQSASEFAADIDRYLTDEPVQASPPSTAYRLGKFVRRHRGPVATAAAIALTILVLGSVAFWQAQVATERAGQIKEKSVLFAAEAAEDPLLKALLVLELAESPETPERLAIARDAADGPLPVAVMQGQGELHAIDFSPDGTRVVTGSSDGSVAIWQADGTGKPVVLSGHEASVQDVAFSPDGARVVSCAFDSTARVWPADGIGPPTILRHGAVLWEVEFSPDGTHVLTDILNFDGPPHIWNVESGDSFALRHHPHGMHPVWAEFTSDGSRVVTTSLDDTRICVWQVDDPAEPTVLRSPIHAYDSVSFAPDGSRFVLAGRDKEGCLWNIEGAGAPVLLRHPSDAAWAEFSPDGTHVVTADEEGTVRVWAADGTGSPTVLARHGQWLYEFYTAPDGYRVLALLRGGTAVVSRMDGTGESLTLGSGGTKIHSSDFSPDGSLVATACADGTARVFSVERVGEPVVVKSPGVWCAEMSHDGTRIASGHWDSTVQIRRADGSGAPAILGAHRRGVNAVSFSPDNTRLVSASWDSTARIWRTDGSEEPVVLSGHEGSLWHASFSPDGARVLTSGRDGTARVWPVYGNGQPLILGLVKMGTYSAVYSSEFSPDGACVLTATHEDNLARLWPTDGSGDPDTLAEHRGLLCASFSPDGSSIVTTSGYDSSVWLWRVGSSDRPVVLRGHTSPVDFASFSPDGSRLLTASEDGEIRVWPADGKSEPLVLRPHEDGLNSAMFTPDGTSIITTGPGEIRIQRVTWPALIDYLRENTHACLTPEQRMKYLAETPSEAWAAYEDRERQLGREPRLKRSD